MGAGSEKERGAPVAMRDGLALELAPGAAPVVLPAAVAAPAPGILDVLDALRGPQVDTLEVEGYPAVLHALLFVLVAGGGRSVGVMRDEGGGADPYRLGRDDRVEADGAVGVGRGAGTVGGWRVEGSESGEVENEVLICLERLEMTHLISRG